jgi:hypothetical protein
VLRNHFNTRTARCSGSDPFAGSVNTEGWDIQYAEYSVREVELRMKGGAVREDISPENEAMF